MKKNRMMRLASILLVCVLLSTSVISGTFAKYTSDVTVTDTAKVAKWDIKLDGGPFTKATTFDFMETWTNSVNTGGQSVKANLLAPGTNGSFTLDVTNNSEVDARFKVNFDFSKLAALPLTYTYKVGSNVYTQGEFVAIKMGDTATITVTWEWPFERTDGEGLTANDAADTTLGEAGATFNITATLVAEQVD